MKTYSRKKLDDPQEEIVDLAELCRLCMNKEEELISIFNNDEPVPLTLRIMACVALEVIEGDCLPDKICHPCKFQLEKSYNFRKKCESSDLKLRQHLFEGQDKDDDQQDEPEAMQFVATIPKSESNNESEIVQSTIVKYIEANNDPEPDPLSITLTQEADKGACTLQNIPMKTEVVDPDENASIFIIENMDQQLDDPHMDVIADAVKATLASQHGVDLSGPIQMKVNPPNGKSTQVEVTTDDGSVIVMELLTEPDEELSPIEPEDDEPAPPPTRSARQSKNHEDESEMKIFKCPDCPKSFARRIQLRRHSSVHMQQRGFSCGICEKWFPTRSALVRHERIHTGERPFQCEVCQKSFAQKEILFRHLMTHTGQKPYNCPQCPRGFSQKEPLRVHMRTHMANPSDIQLHYCSLCPKVFCHASGLSRHLVTHTGKTFKCRDCDKTFTDKSSLRRHHLQTSHQA